MRRSIFQADRSTGLALLRRAPLVHLATTRRDGAPVLRALHSAVPTGSTGAGDHLVFHGAPAGEKLEAIGRPAVVSAEEIVVSIPSTFIDPQRACPATTLYASVQVAGTIEGVDDPELKASALQALMEQHQPEGGHVPIDANHPLYRRAVAGVFVLQISLERLVCKAKLGQNLAADRRRAILEQLWRRGSPGDPRAIELVLAANPDTPRPAFLVAPPAARGTALRCWLPSERASEAAGLVADEYWNVGLRRSAIEAAHRHAAAWVGAEDGAGRLIATARAIGDRAKHAYIYDVAVTAAWRGRGLGAALFGLLLEHPVVRQADRVWLRTKDAHDFYRRFGFGERHRTTGHSTEMVLQRAAV